jgi:hypothetical protein
MIAAAQERARREGSPARFICADAQEHAFEPASVDVMISRFGVMREVRTAERDTSFQFHAGPQVKPSASAHQHRLDLRCGPQHSLVLSMRGGDLEPKR